MSMCVFRQFMLIFDQIQGVPKVPGLPIFSGECYVESKNNPNICYCFFDGEFYGDLGYDLDLDIQGISRSTLKSQMGTR